MSSKVRAMVALRIIVPLMKATPRTTARPVARRRSLWAARLRSAVRNISVSKGLPAVQDPLGGGFGHLVHDPAVGQEHDAVRVGGRAGVVGDHDDRLAQVADRGP